jgi:CubicO group peptidase (beta-lactamase class C family)
MRRDALEALAEHVRGWGVVVRGGTLVHSWGDHTCSADLASARKPIISTLLLLAVQEGLIESVDEPLAK